jgi:DNA-directed RNA polymerase specialized sigma24 family protein
MKQNKNKIDSAKAFKYYCLGLNSKEIAKLLDCSFRTVQNYMNVEKWKQKRDKTTKASN